MVEQIKFTLGLDPEEKIRLLDLMGMAKGLSPVQKIAYLRMALPNDMEVSLLKKDLSEIGDDPTESDYTKIKTAVVKCLTTLH